MKRIKSACLQQTIHFQLKEELGHEVAVRAVQEEYSHYRLQLDRKRTKYKIVDEETQQDGSIIVKIKKQYNDHDCGDYFE